MASGLYKNVIIQGKIFLVFTAIVAVVTRLSALFAPDFLPSNFIYSGGYIWDYLAPFFQNRVASIIGSAVSVGIIAFLLSYINTKNMIIRQKTLLPSAISLLLFSMHPSFMFMGAHYVGVIFILLIVSLLFASYQGEKPQNVAVKTGFLVAIGSLCYFDISLYLPIFLFGLILMRVLNFKSLLAFALGIILIYIPVFTYYFFTDNIGTFTSLFFKKSSVNFSDLPLFNFGVEGWIMFGMAFLVLLMFIFNAYVNSFKDKIRIREFLQLLSAICIYAVLLLLFVNIDAAENMYVALSMASILYAHFFVLSDRFSTQLIFYISVIFCLSFIATTFIFL